MQKSALPVGVKTLHRYYAENRNLDMSCPVQRAGDQWNSLTKSMLIHSMLADFIIPSLYFRKDGGSLSVLDGKQRLSTVFSFINDDFPLHAKTPRVVYDGTEYSLALKTFSELDDDLKSGILGYRFSTYQLEDCTDEEIEETFARLNAGTPLSKIQQARPKMGMELADWCGRLVATGFFQSSLSLTVSQLRREDDFLMLVLAMMLLDGDFKVRTNASAAECVRFAESIKVGYSQEKREMIEGLVGYLNDAFKGAEYKFLKRNNTPIIMCVARSCMERGVSPDDFLNAVVGFYDSGCTEAYLEASGSGNVKMSNISVRLSELSDYVMRYLSEGSAVDTETADAPGDTDDSADGMAEVADDDSGYADDGSYDPDGAASLASADDTDDGAA